MVKMPKFSNPFKRQTPAKESHNVGSHGMGSGGDVRDRFRDAYDPNAGLKRSLTKLERDYHTGVGESDSSLEAIRRAREANKKNKSK